MSVRIINSLSATRTAAAKINDALRDPAISGQRDLQTAYCNIEMLLIEWKALLRAQRVMAGALRKIKSIRNSDDEEWQIAKDALQRSGLS